MYYTCDDQDVPRPATGKTPVRSLRVPDAIWQPAMERAKAEGKTLTEVLIEFLREYGSQDGK